MDLHGCGPGVCLTMCRYAHSCIFFLLVACMPTSRAGVCEFICVCAREWVCVCQVTANSMKGCKRSERVQTVVLKGAGGADWSSHIFKILPLSLITLNLLLTQCVCVCGRLSHLAGKASLIKNVSVSSNKLAEHF